MLHLPGLVVPSGDLLWLQLPFHGKVLRFDDMVGKREHIQGWWKDAVLAGSEDIWVLIWRAHCLYPGTHRPQAPILTPMHRSTWDYRQDNGDNKVPGPSPETTECLGCTCTFLYPTAGTTIPECSSLNPQRTGLRERATGRPCFRFLCVFSELK